MFIKQLSVFVENKSGRLAEITAVLAGAGIDIRARDEGRACVLLRFTQEDTDKAVAALQAANIEILDAGRIYSM